MQGFELQHRLSEYSCLSPYFLGVFAADELKKNLQRAKPRSFLIANVQNASEPGSHWFTVFKTSATTCETFDSLGQSEETARQRVGKFSHCVFNQSRVQADSSKNCGKFAVYFCVTRVLNYQEPFPEVFSECFTPDLDFNESVVNRFWESGQLYNAGEF